MDGSRFDELTKRLATSVPRRRVVKGLTGGFVAGVAALRGRSGVDAQRVTQAYCGNVVCAGDPNVCRDGCDCCVFRNGNSRCMPPNDCTRLGGEAACDPTTGCCADTDCSGGQVCDGGTCTCPAGTLACGDECLCGCPSGTSCEFCQFEFLGRVCPAGSSCIAGGCTAETCTIAFSGAIRCVGTGASCVCATSIEQEPVCVDINYGSNCPRPDQCQSSGDCPSGTVCVKGADTSPPGVCTFNACLPVC